MKTFSDFTLPPVLLQALEAMEFKMPSPIQAQAIGPALEGKDILAIAPTGTGKTGAFGIPNLSFLYPQPGKQVLILAPTRELAAQIHRFLRDLGKTMDVKGVLIVGGESYSRQRTDVKRGVDYIVATPGRLMDHINQGMPTEKIGVLVLDEVDRMLDMGFAPQVEEIVNRLGPERQTFLFSATMPPEILKLANKYLKDPVRVKVEGKPEEKALIDEENIDTTDAEKPALLVEQVAARTGKILVFANTQGRVEQVARRLHGAGHATACIHGARTHRERKLALEAFRSGECRVLVATDIVARGIDVVDIEHVINYDYPATKEDYLHRIGRTGRMGKKGNSVTFVDPKRKHMSRRRPPGQRTGGGGFSTGPRSHSARPAFRPSPREFEKPAHGPRSDAPRFERPRFDKPGFEKPRFEKPRFEGGERPRFEKPRVEGGERPRFDKPRFEGGERPRFDKPRFEGGERPRFDKPRFGAGERSSFKPRFENGERPRFDKPRFEGGERPRFDKPRFEKGAGDRPAFARGPRSEGAPGRPAFNSGRFENRDRPRFDRGGGGGKAGFNKFDRGPRQGGGGFKPRFDSGGDRPPHPNIFRDNEMKPHSPASGPRFSKRPFAPKKEYQPKAKPGWVRGKGGSVRRDKGKHAPQTPGFDNHGLEIPS